VGVSKPDRAGSKVRVRIDGSSGGDIFLSLARRHARNDGPGGAIIRLSRQVLRTSCGPRLLPEIAQEFQIRPNSTVPDTLGMEWNYLTFNGRCGPLTTPLLCKLGERVRIRFVNFSVIDHHPIHLHGHTFWVTSTEGGRMPETAWSPSDKVLVGVAQVREVESIANNPGDWVMHCHMFHYMMNSMTTPAGPFIRNNSTLKQRNVLGFPQIMLGMEMLASQELTMPGMDMKPVEMKNMSKESSEDPTGEHDPSKMQPDATQQRRMQQEMLGQKERQAMGMRPAWSMGVEGLMNVVRVLPPELYDKIMNTNQPSPRNTTTPADPGNPMHHMNHSGMKMDSKKD